MVEKELKWDARMLSMFGQNGAVFGWALPQIHEAYPAKILTSDMAAGAGLARFKSLYPSDFYDVGIAEQNLLGMTAGLCSEGCKCVAEAQACFLTMRGFEQVRQYFGYMGLPAVLVGINSGFALTYFGNSHYALEDLALMRTVPGMMVLSPADAGEAVKAFIAALKADVPVYLRLSGLPNLPVVYADDFDYEPGKLTLLYDRGSDYVLFATGTMVYPCLRVAEQLAEENRFGKVVDVHTIKPLDREGILDLSRDAKVVFSVEEHFVTGGLGSAVAEVLAGEGNMPALVRLGVKDGFSAVGDYHYLLEQHGLTQEGILSSVRTQLGL